MKDRKITLIVASPAGRAQESAAIFKSALGLPLKTDPRLRPIELGRGPRGELSFEERSAEWQAGKDPSPPGGESIAQIGARVDELARALRAERPGVSVLLVAHGEVIASWLGHVRKIQPWLRFALRVENASVTVVDVAADGSTVRIENQTDDRP